MIKNVIRLIRFLLVLQWMIGSNLYSSIEIHNISFPSLKKKIDGQGNESFFAQEGIPFTIKIEFGSTEKIIKRSVDYEDSFVSAGGQTSISIGLHGTSKQSSGFWEYTLIPSKSGTFKIGPIRIQGESSEVRSGVFYVTVEPNHFAMASSNKQEEVWCDLIANKQEVFVEEPLEVSVVLYSKIPIYKAISINFNDPENDFIIKKIEEPVKNRMLKDGQTCFFWEFKYVLFPRKSGMKKLAEQHVLYDRDVLAQTILGPMRTTQECIAPSNQLSIKVKELPPVDGGQPLLIGDFSVYKAHVDRTHAQVGEILTCVVTIEGRGNIDKIPDVTLEVPPALDYHKNRSLPSEDLSISYQGGKKVFEFMIQGRQPGEYEIKAQDIPYFDVTSGVYRTLRCSPIKISFAGESIKEQDKESDPEKREENATHTDLKYPVFSVSGRCGFMMSNIPELIFFVLLLLPFVCVGYYLYQPLRRRIGVMLKRRLTQEEILENFSQELNTLIKNQQIQDMYMFFIKFCAFILDFDERDISQEKLEDLLHKKGWEIYQINQFSAFLDTCLNVKFGFNGQDRPLQKSVVDQAYQWFLLLQKEKIE